MKIQTQTGSRGFTLLEIMIALFLLGLIVAAVYSSWMAIVHGSDTGRRAAAAVQRSRIAVRTLEDALTSARSFAADLDDYSFVAENGDRASLSFVSRLSQSFPRSGKFGDFDVRRLTFSLEPAPGSASAQFGQQLVLRQNPILMDLDVDEQEHPIVLAKDVRKFEMAFYNLRKGEWQDEWLETNSLPKLVKITLEFGSGNEQSKVREDVTRVIALPAGTVTSSWQVSGLPPAPSQPSIIKPGQPNPTGGMP